jgi:hypothetical protein
MTRTKIASVSAPANTLMNASTNTIKTHVAHTSRYTSSRYRDGVGPVCPW